MCINIYYERIYALCVYSHVNAIYEYCTEFLFFGYLHYILGIKVVKYNRNNSRKRLCHVFFFYRNINNFNVVSFRPSMLMKNLGRLARRFKHTFQTFSYYLLQCFLLQIFEFTVCKVGLNLVPCQTWCILGYLLSLYLILYLDICLSLWMIQNS